MLFYWLIFGILSAAALTYRVEFVQAGVPTAPRPRSAVPLLWAVALIIIVGLRYRVGGDWHNYQLIFESVIRRPLMRAIDLSPTEPGYTFVNWLAGELGAGMWLVNLICAIPFSWGLTRLCKQQPNPWLSLVVAWPFLIIVVGMGFTRQGVALGFLMGGLAEYLGRRSLTRFVFLVLCGALFHKTVLIFIPIILLVSGPSRAVSLALAVLAVGLAYLTVFETGRSYSAGYLNVRYEAAGAQVRTLMNLVPAMLLLLSGDKFYRTPEERTVWRTFAWLAVACATALPIVPSSVIVDRLGMFLIPLQMFVLGRASLVFANDPRVDLAPRVAVVAYSAAVLFVWLTYGHFSMGWIPYRNYLVPHGA